MKREALKHVDKRAVARTTHRIERASKDAASSLGNVYRLASALKPEEAMAAYRRASKAFDKTVDRIDDAMTENRWSVLVGALALGGLAGMLLSPKRRRRRW